MSQWEYEENRKIVEKAAIVRRAAEKYVEDCLAIMDGSVEAGMARIGSERFNETVNKIIANLPGPKE